MSEFTAPIRMLALMYKAFSQAETNRDEFRLRNRGFQDEVGRGYEEEATNWENRIERVLRRLTKIPPHHSRHEPHLANFYDQAGEYEITGRYHNSVFIMTKFPDPRQAHPSDQELERVIKVIADSVKKAGFCPRIARQDHHTWLWDNVELYLLACGLGIAVLEDRYRPELNPNVALEWGWMKGMGKPVLFLEETEFKNRRADWQGLISHSFTWANPEAEIDAAVAVFLRQQGPLVPRGVI